MQQVQKKGGFEVSMRVCERIGEWVSTIKRNDVRRTSYARELSESRHRPDTQACSAPAHQASADRRRASFEVAFFS
jgi:hypothetical protein